MTESYKHLVDKLNLYIKKYNLYQLIKGTIYCIILFTSYFTLISVIEYFAFLPSFARTFIFYFSFFLFSGISIFYFIVPLLRLAGLLKTMGYEKAAFIVSRHFKEIDDRLLNILELAKIEKEANQPLVWASIDEKINRIRLFDFSKVVSFKSLSNKLLFLSGALIAAFLLFLFLPGLFTDTSKRLVAYDQVFIKPAPFTFHLLNDSLQVKKGEQLSLGVKCEGSEIPELLYVNIAGTNYMMNNEAHTFSYQLEHVNNSFTIYFTDLTYKSEKYLIEVLPSPVILEYVVEVEPPVYTGYEKRKENMLGDLEVPFGSKIKWVFNTAGTDSLSIRLQDKIVSAENENGKFQFEHIIKSSLDYSVSLKNKHFNYQDILSFSINIIPDLYPEIKVVQLRDSFEFTRFYFKGSVADDYGFHDLNYHLVINGNDSLTEIPVHKSLNQQDFYFTYNFKDLKGAVDQVDYYFSVRDNDYFHGYKESVSETFQFVFPSKEELKQLDDENFDNLEDLLEKSYELSNDIQKSIEELKYRSLSEKTSNWEKQQLVSEIMNKKNQLEEILNQVQQKNSEMNSMKNSFSEEKAEMVEKQKQIDQLLEEVFNEELKALFEEFNKLAQEFDQDKFDELSNRSEMSMEDLSKQLERNLQMLKRMKVEQKVEEVIEGLSDLGKKERDNAKQLDESRSFEEAGKKEDENREELKSINEDLKKALELNESLEKPMNIQPLDREYDEINSKYDEIGELLEQKRKKKSVDQIEKNAEKYDNAAFMLNQMLAGNKLQQNMENIRDLQQILDNLIYLSLTQETLHDKIRAIDESDPRLSVVKINQDRLIRQSQVVKDSLYALGKRTPQIGSVITKELLSLELSMNKAIDELVESRLGTAVRHQQMAITSANNMALLLNEALDNLQKQMANAMPGDQQCDKPGSNPGDNMNLLKETQQSLKDQLQQMIDQMKDGNSGSMSEQIGKSLAQQEMMQQMIRELLMNSEVGSAAKEQLKQIDQLLERANLDLANKNVTSTMIERQNLILNKLLKAEKAEMERDVEDERESKTVDDNFYSNPIEFFEYKNEDKEFIDIIERNNYQLRIFYDRKYREYINNLRNNN